MTDIRVVWDPVELIGDWIMKGSVLDTDRELVTAIAISLFTDGLAYEDDPLPDPNDPDRRGWWGDHEGREIHGQTQGIGSRLWLISREKQTELTRARAEKYAREALNWLIDLRVADAYTVKAYYFRPAMLGIEIEVIRRGKSTIAGRFEPLWDQLDLAA